MQRNSISKLRQQLFEETDGNKFSILKEKLLKTYAETQRELVAEILSEYIKEGKITHWRNFLLTDLIDIVNENENKYADFFKWTITVPALTYWGIDGLLKTYGKEGYEKLVELIKDKNLPVSIRAKAIKSISEFSNQTFDKGLPEDPGYWKTEDLKIADVIKWQQIGYPEGLGYTKPPTHPALRKPISEFEKVVAKLDKKLEKLRNKSQDLSNPSNWLVLADERDIYEIQQRWALPENYIQFLKNFSPLKVEIYSKKFVSSLSLYGADYLIEGQNGYSFNAMSQQNIIDWPTNFVVIGDDGGDPFCIDLDATNDGDAPIYTSMHGQDRWEFEKISESFMIFLKSLA